MNEDGNYLEAHSAIHELNIIYDCYRVMFVIQYIVTSAIVHTTVCYYNRLRLWTSGVWTKRGGGVLKGCSLPRVGKMLESFRLKIHF